MPKRIDREGPIHRSIIDYLRNVLPGSVVYHPANEIDARGKNIARAIAKNKWNGTLPGYPDIICHYRGRTVLFEVKAPGNGLEKSQKAMRAALEAQDIPYGLVRSIEDTKECLGAWGITTTGR